jgi:hypothetical protein
MDDEVTRWVADVARPGQLTPAARDALLAWLLAFRRHWPSAYRRIFGDTGEELVGALEVDCDANKVLKLRRIAVENLARIL